MTLVFMLFSSWSARAVEFTLPYRTVDVNCVGEGHQILLSWDFSRSPFLESAVVDGVDHGENVPSSREAEVITYGQEGVFTLAVPAQDENIRKFETVATIRSVPVPMRCTISIDWHITK